ncbi:MAG: HEAT repeat domain-containing protein [Thermoguttaceae bacterium]|nr:HEAT repeat domain-containing protein [Thermoguttaceae bacterium]
MKRMMALLAAVVLCWNVVPVMAQDADVAAKFAELLPQMSSDDVGGAQQTSQKDWMRIVLDATAPGKDVDREKVNALMIGALQGDAPVITKAWLLHLLQWSGTAKEVPEIAKFLGNDEVRLRDAAARALSNNPCEEAYQTLEAAQKVGTDAERIAAAIKDRTKEVADPGDESEMPQALPYVSVSVEKKLEWLGKWNEMDSVAKTRTLAGLKVLFVNQKVFRQMRIANAEKTGNQDVQRVRAEPQNRAAGESRMARREMAGPAAPVMAMAKECALAAVKSDDCEAKKAGVLLLGEIANAGDLPVLTELLFSYDRGLMIGVMKNLVSDGFDQALFQAMLNESDAGRLETLADICAGRFNVDAAQAILAVAKKADCPNRFRMLQIAEGVSTKANVSDYVDALLLIPAGGDRDRVEQMIARLSSGDAEPVVAKLNDENTAELLPCIGRVGGEKALEVVSRAFNSNMQREAIRAYCNWPNAVVADKLWEISQTDALDDADQIAAMRAFIRVGSLPDEEIGIQTTAAAKLDSMKKAFEKAMRVDEKKLAIERAAAIRDLATLQWALTFLGNDELSASGYKTIVELGHHDFLRKAHKAEFRDALQKVIDSCKDEGLVNRAKDYIGKIPQ